VSGFFTGRFVGGGKNRLECYLLPPQLGWCRERGKIDWQEQSKFDCRLGRTIFIFFPWSIFTQEWPENQILIPDWTYFHCPDATQLHHNAATT